MYRATQQVQHQQDSVHSSRAYHAATTGITDISQFSRTPYNTLKS
ncbi:MAG: hypothetical protein OJF49_004499 [Ktedonobacterales bacterium]|nr:MAG: hypothetical protein OJF49_004499 [Ktedonobacterales bacterium]